MVLIIKNKILSLLNGCLWFFAIGFALTTPMRGYMNNIYPKLSSTSLGMAIGFSVILCMLFLLQKKLISVLRGNKVLPLLFLVVFGLTTYKFLADCLAGTAGSILSYYAIPAFLFSVVAFAIWFAEDSSRMFPLMQVYALAFCVVYLIYSGNFIMDVGGVVRSVGNYSNPNEMSIYAFFALCFAVILVFRRQYFVYGNLILASISSAAIILGESRTATGAIIGGAVVTAVVYWANSRRARRETSIKQLNFNKIFHASLSIGAFVLMTLMAAFLLHPDLLTVTDIRGEHYTLEGRRELIKAYPELESKFEELYNISEEGGDSPLTDESEREAESSVTSQEPSSGDSLGSFGTNAVERFLTRIFFGNKTESSSLLSNLRFTIWAKYLTKVKDYWLIGAENGFTSVSPVVDKTTRACHNTFLYMFVQYGIFAMGLIVALTIILIKKHIFTPNDNPQMAPLAGLLTGLLFFLMFSDLVSVSVVWLSLAILCGVTPDHATDQPISIAILRRFGGYGGIEHQVVNICAGLIQKGYRVCLITDTDSPMSARVEAAGGIVIVMPLGNIVAAGLRIARYCRKNGVAILQTHMLFESFIGKAARFFFGDLLHVFRVHTYIDCSQISKGKKNLYQLASFMTDGFVDRYISINEFNVKELIGRTHISSRKVAVVHNGVADHGEPFEGRVLPEKKIAMIANFVAFKGHDILIEGMELLKEQGVPISAHLDGGCPLDDKGHVDDAVLRGLQDIVRKKTLEKSVLFCGSTSNVRETLKDKWALVLPSYAEGTPNCVLEAMSLKVLTISSAVGGVPEFVEDGINGFSHEARSPQAFADAILRALELSPEEERAVCDRAWQTWQQQYSVEPLIDGLIAEYRILLPH
jgi:glycosyltransferase involved in cell wall biosynthesis/O-antigen ligase